MQENRYTNRRYLCTKSALLLDGIDDYIKFGFNRMADQGAFSVCFKPISLPALPDDMGIISYTNDGIGSSDWMNVSIANSGLDIGKIKVSMTLGGSATFTFPMQARIGEAVNILVNYSSTSFEVYSNGILRYSNNSSFAWNYSSIAGLATAYLLIGKNYPSATTSNIEVSHISFFDRPLTIAEIIHIHRFSGLIPQNARQACIFHWTGQYDTITKGYKQGTSLPSSIVPINQVSHGLSVGNAIYYNGSIWVKADSSNLLTHSNPPTVVVSVAGANDFSYSQEGVATISTASMGVDGDLAYCQPDGSIGVARTQNIIGRIIDFNTLSIYGGLEYYASSSTTQYNVAAASPQSEDYGVIFGKSDSDFSLSDNYITATNPSTIDYHSDSQYTISAIEPKSGYASLDRGLLLGSITAGYASDTYVNLDKTYIPNENTDDYTFIWQGTVHNKNYVDVSDYGREHFFLLTSLNNGTWNLSNRIQFAIAYEDNVIPSGFPILFAARTNNATSNPAFNYTFADSKGLFGSFLTIGMSYKSSTNIRRIYFNGYEVASGSSLPPVNFNTPSALFRLNNLTVGSGSSFMYAGHRVYGFGHWNRVLHPSEMLHLHNNGQFNNPWSHLYVYHGRKMQDGLLTWHNFSPSEIYDNAGTIKIRNQADISGTTDAVLVGYSLANAQSRTYPKQDLQ